MSADTTEQTLRETFIATTAPVIREWSIANAPVPDRWARDPDTWRFIQHRDTPGGREYAAQLYGAVTALNGPMGAIVKAAEAAESERSTAAGYDDLRFPVLDFFRAIAVESLGGAKDDPMLKFRVAAGRLKSEQGGPAATKLLEVPRLTIEGAQS